MADSRSASETKSLARRLVTGGAWAAAGRVLGMAFGFFTTVALTRLLAPAPMGSFFLAFTVASVLAILARVGLERTLVRRISEALERGQPGRARTALLDVARVGLIGTVVVCTAFATFFGDWLGNTIFKAADFSDVRAITAVWIAALSAQALLAEAFRGLHDIGGAMLYGGTLAGGITLAVLGVVLLLGDPLSLGEAVGLSAVSIVLATALGGAVLARRFRELPVGAPSPSEPVLREAIPVLVINLTAYVMLHIGLWVVGSYLSEQDAALFGGATRLVFLVGTWLTIVNQVVPPVIVELDVRGDRRLLERVLRSTAAVAAVPGLIVLAVFVSAGSLVMSLLYGSYYEAGGAILCALSVGQAVNLLTGSCGFTLIMTGRQDIVMMISLVSGAIAVVSAISAVHLGGPLAVAWALSLVFSAHQLVLLFAARKLCGVWTHVDFARLAPELKRLWGQWSKP